MRTIAAIFLSFFLFSTPLSKAYGFENLDACADISQPKKKAKDLKSGPAFMSLVLGLEKQGKGKLRPEYEAPKSQCLLAQFDTTAGKVAAVYSPWAKGMQTLHYRFLSDGTSEQREFLVLYNGMASMMAGGMIFYVTETQGGITKYYAAYTSQPNFKQLKKLVSKIVEGKAESIAEVQWPESSDELVITKYDSKHFK